METDWLDDDGEACDAVCERELQSVQQLNRSFSALPALRFLDSKRHNPTVEAGVGISSLTRLTNLRFNGLDLDPMTFLVDDVLGPLRHLLSRTLHGGELVDEAGMRLLAAECSQLTCLTFEDQAYTDFTGFSGVGGRRGSVPLPAALRELHLDNIQGGAMRPAGAAAAPRPHAARCREPHCVLLLRLVV